MVDHWKGPIEDERLFREKQAEAHSVLNLHNRHAPPPLQGERLEQYDRRLTYEIQKCAPNFKDLNIYDARGDAYNLLKQQVKVDAQQEAHHPTNIPEGELREVTNYDQAGRPFYTFYGKPSAWLKDFTAPKKWLTGIRTRNLNYGE